MSVGWGQAAVEEVAQGQVAALQQEHTVGSFMQRGQVHKLPSKLLPNTNQQAKQEQPKVPLPPPPPGSRLWAALLGQGDARPLSQRLTELVVDWVELRGDRPVPKPKVAGSSYSHHPLAHPLFIYLWGALGRGVGF